VPKCHFCKVDIETLEDNPIVVQISAFRIGGHGAYDPDAIPEYVDRLLQKMVTRIECCTTCAGDNFPYTGELDTIHVPVIPT
jgi:hypothetical protein